MDSPQDRAHASGHHHRFDSPEMAAYAELEGEVFTPLVSEALAVLAGLCERRGLGVHRVLDLGCGPGVGTCVLAEQFPSATVVAVDGSAAMLGHLASRAARLGLSARIEPRHAELPDELDALGPADVVWASMVLHHIGDETAALGRIGALLEPGGLFALVEREGPLRVELEGDDLDRPGLWDRLDGAWAAFFDDMRAGLGGPSAADGYPAMLAAAGFEVLADEVLTLVLSAPLDHRTRRFAHQHLSRSRRALAPHADVDDLAALDPLVGEDHAASLLHRDDASLRTSRHLYIARAAGVPAIPTKRALDDWRPGAATAPYGSNQPRRGAVPST